jgi:hypothetical protein
MMLRNEGLRRNARAALMIGCRQSFHAQKQRAAPHRTPSKAKRVEKRVSSR